MPREATLYADVLGFKGQALGSAAGAVDALEALADVLSAESSLESLLGLDTWRHRYALSDSVILTRTDVAGAIRAGADLMFNLATESGRRRGPVLLRAGIGYGRVRHLKGIFSRQRKPANVVGEGVLDAIALVEQSGLKGPRLFISATALARVRDRGLRGRLIAPTEVGGVSEILWLLPLGPAEIGASGMESQIRAVGDMAVRLLKRYGGHPVYGGHYREFLLLVIRSALRLKQWGRPWSERASRLVDRKRIEKVLSITTGLPDLFRMSVEAGMNALS